MHTEEIRIPGTTTLGGQLTLPEKEGIFPGIVLSHGFASCKEEFMGLPHALAQAGYAVLAFDYSGHGQSTGAKTYLTAHSHLDDILRAYQHLVSDPRIDVNRTALIGHSMGTSAVLRLLGTKIGTNISCAAVLAPPYQMRQNVKPLEKVAYAVLAALAKPVLALSGQHIQIPYRVGPKDIYISAEAMERAKAMKILSPMISVNNYEYAMVEQDNGKYAEKVTTPTLVMAAEKDTLIPPAHSEKVYQALATDQKQWVVIEDSGHSLLGDRQAKKATAQILDWLKPYLAGEN